MSVGKMKDGKRWYVYCRYKDYSGKVHQHKKEGFQKKSDALSYEREYLAKKTGSSDMTLRSLYELYIADCESRNRLTVVKTKKSTYEKQVLPYIGNLEVSKITPSIIREWQNQLLSTGQYSSSYLRTIQRNLSAMFNFGTRFYGMPTNPCRAAGNFKKDQDAGVDFWTLDEFNTFIGSLRDDPSAVAIITTLYWTGMRRGELFALTLNDIDFGAHTISITKTYTRINREDVVQPPKTQRSNRTIYVSEAILRLLKGYADTLYDLKDDDRIFGSYSIQRLENAMNRGCERSGVKHIRVHDLRHSHASYLIEQGCSPLLISERLGHSDVETTLQIYSHLYPGKQEEIANQMNPEIKCYDFATHDFS